MVGYPMRLCCGTVCGGGVWEGTVPLALCQFSVTFPATHNQIRHSGADSQVSGLVYILGPCGSLPWTLLWGWEFLPLLPQPPQVFSVRGFEALFPGTGTLGCAICLTLQLFLPVYLHANVGPPGLPATALPLVLSVPCCPFLTLLPVWMNVSSLTPWLSDFHTVWFSVSSGCFCFYICCCPSFGCVRRHSVSTYASILAGSLNLESHLRRSL